MDVGSEISNKIRSAIKAKLVELNAYVDEELPDYIMVMVANKKSQLQMSDDLCLFLGANTEKFTTWLHGLLQKLQSLTSDTSAVILGSTSTSKTEKSVERTKTKEHASSTSEGSSKHRRHNEKHVADEIKSKKRASDDHSSEDKKERKRRKSDQEKRSKNTGDDTLDSDHAKTKQVPEKTDVVSSIIVVSSDSITTEETSLSSVNAEPKKDETDCVTKFHVPPQPVDFEKLDNVEPDITVNSEHDIKGQETRTVEIETNDFKQSSNTIDVSDIQVEDNDLTELLLTEPDELAEELEQEPAVVLPVKKSDFGKAAVIRISDDEVGAKAKRGATSVTISSDSSKDNSPPRSSRPRAVTSPLSQTGRRSAVVRAVEPRPAERGLFTRKRRAPVSVIGSISRDSDNEEGYDPRNPAVGNVASVVKVTARKSSVPPKLQANKSLLLKAMTEAEKSVENQRRVAVTPIRPFMRSEGRDRDRDRDHERRGHSSSHSSSSSSRDRESRRHSPTPRIAQASLRQAISQPRSSHQSPPVYIPTRKVQPALRVDSNDSVGIVSKSRRQEAQERAWLDREQESSPPRKFVKSEKATPIVNFIIETERDTEKDDPQQQSETDSSSVMVKKEPISPLPKPPYPDPSTAKQAKKLLDSEIDSRVVEYEPEMVSSPARSVSESGSQGVPALLEDMDHEEFLLDQDVLELTESSSGLLEEDHRQAMIKDKPKDKTRFVVTLDGVDTDQYEVNAMETDTVEEQMAVDKIQPIKMNQLPAAPASELVTLPKESPAVLISPPKIQPLNISLKDSDEEGEPMEAEVTPLKKAKMLERCKFWPACVNGVACDYHHPTIHCKTFPMCKFGDKCLYIHPNCRFDSKCIRPDCPYTHSSVRSIPPFQAPYKPAYRAPAPPPPPAMSAYGMSSPQCKFFPNCSNMSCPFFHPKPCRFGLTCKNKDKGCPFYHPPLPTMDKLTWVATKGAVVSPIDALKETKKVE